MACEVSSALALLLPLQGEKVGMRGRFRIKIASKKVRLGGASVAQIREQHFGHRHELGRGLINSSGVDHDA
jgi:hypothetical protein